MGTRLCSEPAGQPGPDSCRGTCLDKVFLGTSGCLPVVGGGGGAGADAPEGLLPWDQLALSLVLSNPGSLSVGGRPPGSGVICPFLPQRSLTKEMGRGQRCPPLGDRR